MAMATLEALEAILKDQNAPPIIQNHVIDALQYALRNYGGYFSEKELRWLAQWNDARIPLAANRLLKENGLR
jgi:hypothetical protein